MQWAMGEPPSIDSIDVVHISEIYRKPQPVFEDNACSVPYSLLPGEGASYCGSTTDGIIVLSNYRLYLSVNPFVNIPLGLIEQVECRDIFHLYIYCKDARSFRCTFSNNEKCQEWFKRIQKATMPSNKLDNQFCFAFFVWSRDERREDLFAQLNQKSLKEDSDIPEIYIEAERMGFNLKKVWKIVKINENYSLCPSYPRHIIVPASATDENLQTVANFRYSRRIPAIVWRHQQNGCVIARCSQPEVGWFGSRKSEDEDLIQAIADACTADPGLEQTCAEIQETYSMKSDLDGDMSLLPRVRTNSGEKGKGKMLIVDARSYAAAFANRAKGGGFECVEYYPNCEVQFLGLANIHSIRKSFMLLRTLCSSVPEPQTWLSSLEGTRWLQYIAGLIQAALLVVNAVDVERRPVVVHCSDGWDRTPQIVALAELMMDPYYRTKEGFRLLVEREWLEFGHKFADRCGHSTGTTDLNERSPVFLQWIDCVHQLVHQFPCYFEFNQQYLVKLVHHIYSCLFGTFLCNTDQERRVNCVHERTFCLWSFLNGSTDYHNYLFNNSSEVLRPSFQVKDLEFWSEVYMPTDSVSLGKPTVSSQETTTEEKIDGIPLVKTKSCDDISAIGHPYGRQRRSSDPNIVQNASLTEDSHLLNSEETQLSISDTAFSALKNSDLDRNGNPSDVDIYSKGYITDPRTHSIGISKILSSCSNLICREPAIDGSTDTLVSESGIIPKVSNVDQIKTPCQSEEVVPSGKQVCSISTSTSDLPRAIDGMPDAFMPNSELSDSKWSPWCQAVLEAYIASKKTSSSSCNRSYATPHHSRTPSSGFPATPCDDANDVTLNKGRALPYQALGVDGSDIIITEVQEQIQKLICHYKRKIRNLECDLWVAQNDFVQQVCIRCQGKDRNFIDGDDVMSLPDSTCSGEQRIENSPGSDFSWEPLEKPNQAMWVPDHAVSNCSGCDAKFWVVKRKHHCRKCGQIFCSNCSSQVMPVPAEQLYHPVRVCNYCFAALQLQCRESISPCDKLPKAVITAASN